MAGRVLAFAARGARRVAVGAATVCCVVWAVALGPAASAGSTKASASEMRPTSRKVLRAARATPTPSAKAARPASQWAAGGRSVLRQVAADERGGSHWVRWAVIGAGAAAAGTATYLVLTRNHLPTPGTIGVSPGTRGMAGATTFLFESVGASDPDRDALIYSWSLGDGTQAQGRQVAHAYSSPGTYTISLTVSDGRSEPIPSPVASVTVERNLAGSWSGGHALPVMNPLRLELVHDAIGLSGMLVAETYRGTPGGASLIEGRIDGDTYPCRVFWSTVLLDAVTLRFEGSVESAESDVMTGMITVDRPGEFSHTGQTTFRR